ncbi:MAG: translocation/assembly module TamB domain-containing protein [Myxococcota bacterium]
MRGNVGGGKFDVNGTIESRDWVPVRYDLAMSAQDAMVQWVTSLPPAIGDGTFQFDGPADALLLSGDVTVTDMTFADRIDWEDWVVEYRDWMLVDPASVSDDPPMFSMNVAIVADDTIHLQNNVAEGTASADLRIIGDTVRPGLVGSVEVDNDGLVFLQDREFRVERGNLLFNDLWTWDPQLDLSLVTDITSYDQRYRVNYLIKGPFSDWRTETRSDPPLPQADVNALLWFGVTTDQLEEMGELSSAVAQGVADLLVTDFLISGQAGEIGEDLSDLLWDRIDVTTGVNARGQYSSEPRLVIEKRLPENLGDVDVKWEVNLVRPNDEYVTASKRIGGAWSLAAWYATLQRDRVLPIGGAYGLDVVARWEFE